jgi:predicted nuclease of restriction endonuclease-like RecB superfamily
MLTADLVLAHRRKGELVLPELSGKAGQSVRFWAEQVLDTARSCVGLPREQYASLVQVMGETLQERKLARGLSKLVEDACQFEAASSEESAAIRQELFLLATEVRQSSLSNTEWVREAIIQTACANHGWSPSTVDERLYADLPGAQRLLRVPDWTVFDLVSSYDTSRIQAVLLRAVQVRVNYAQTSSVQLRELFRQLKFRRLLHRSERNREQGLCLTIDGPYSLFESVTKYGLQMALLMPALQATGSFELKADVQWGVRREPLLFRHLHNAREQGVVLLQQANEQSEYADELGQLLSDLAAANSTFQASPATILLDLPGVGICVPDITFVDASAPSRRVHFELLGYWSRASVWKRVELVEAGLQEPVLFGVNQRLRVSEEVIDKDAPSALYVFRGRPNAKTLLQRVERLASRMRHGL